MELKNSENTTVVVLQVKKAHKEKQTYWLNHEKGVAEKAWQSVQTDLCSLISFRSKEPSIDMFDVTKASV